MSKELLYTYSSSGIGVMASPLRPSVYDIKIKAGGLTAPRLYLHTVESSSRLLEFYRFHMDLSGLNLLRLNELFSFEVFLAFLFLFLSLFFPFLLCLDLRFLLVHLNAVSHIPPLMFQFVSDVPDYF